PSGSHACGPCWNELYLSGRRKHLTILMLKTPMKATLLSFGVVLFALTPQRGQAPAPTVDHHQHLYSPATVELAPEFNRLAADDLIKLLDQAGIRRAVVLSTAYQFGNPNRPAVENEYEKVKAENDWTSQQVARYSERLRGFCGVNPLKSYALDEIERCAKDP